MSVSFLQTVPCYDYKGIILLPLSPPIIVQNGQYACRELYSYAASILQGVIYDLGILANP